MDAASNCYIGRVNGWAETFAASFAVVFVAELADKSRLVGLLLATAFRSRWRVFWGMTAGYALLDGAAVAAGAALGARLGGPWLARGCGALFLAFGAAAWLAPPETEDRARGLLSRFESLGPFVVSFLAIALSELGDRTQLASAALAARAASAWAVYAGVLGALALLNALTVAAGEALAARLDPRLIRRAGGALFAALGAAMLLGSLARP